MQTLMLLCALKGNVLRGFDKIQKWVDLEHARGELLSKECEWLWAEHEALAGKARAIESQVAELEEDRCTLWEDVLTLRGV